MPKIAVVGSANVDLIARVKRLPEPGETVIGTEFLHAMGGKGANQAVAAAKLGAEVSFIARVGDDSYGEACLQSYRAVGIDTRTIQATPNVPTGLAMIGVAEDGENDIIVISGANAYLTPQDVEMFAQTIWEADAVLLQLEIPFETVCRAIDLAHEVGRRVILNPAPYRALPREVLQKVSVLTPNVNETEYLLNGVMADDEMLSKAVLGAGVSSAVITRGSRGCLVTGSWGWVKLPALDVTPVDTTGAGDTFSAALTVALAEGKSLDQAARFAIVAAGLSVTKFGAQPAIPTRAEVEAALAELPL